MRKPSYGTKRANLSPSRTSTGLRMRMKRLAAFCSTIARGLQQEHERPGRAVHDRHFRRGQFDKGVVDAQSRQRGHQVLDGLHLGRAAGQAGAQHGLADQVGVGRDLDHGIEVDAAEHDAGIHRRRAQGQEDLLAAMQANAGGADQVLEGALAQHRWRLPRRLLNLNVNRSVPAAHDAGTKTAGRLTPTDRKTRRAGNPARLDMDSTRAHLPRAREAGVFPDQSAWRRRNAGISR